MHIHPSQHKVITNIDIFTFLACLPPITFPKFDFNLIGLPNNWSIASKTIEFNHQSGIIQYKFSIVDGKIAKILSPSPFVSIYSTTYEVGNKYAIKSQKIQDLTFFTASNLNNTIKYAQENKGLISFI